MIIIFENHLANKTSCLDKQPEKALRPRSLTSSSKQGILLRLSLTLNHFIHLHTKDFHLASTQNCFLELPKGDRLSNRIARNLGIRYSKTLLF